MASITASAQEEQQATIRARADDEPKRIQTSPRSGDGGWTITRRCAISKVLSYSSDMDG